MTLPKKANIVQELVYIDGQDEPVLMTVDRSIPKGGQLHDIKEECIRRGRVRKYREKKAAKEEAAHRAYIAEKKAAKKARKRAAT